MKLFISLILLFTLSSCYNIERNCSDYKNGTFEFNYNIDGIEKTGRFVRSDTLSIEYYDERIDSSSVRWINDCEFILKTINPKSNAEKEAIHMKILSTTDSSYTFEYKHAIKNANRELRIERGVAIKIN